MRLVCDPDGDARTLATDIERADSLLAQMRGLMFRSSFPADAALVFPFENATTRDVHMLFVRFPIDVLWLVDNRVRRVERLQPWIGFARDQADMLIELPAGGADGITEGDRVVLEDG